MNLQWVQKTGENPCKYISQMLKKNTKSKNGECVTHFPKPNPKQIKKENV